MKVLFFLSGNNIFAKDEVFSLFESYELKYEIIYDEGQLLILKISKSNIDFISRLGLTHFVLDVICDFDIDKKINENIFDIDWDFYHN